MLVGSRMSVVDCKPFLIRRLCMNSPLAAAAGIFYSDSHINEIALGQRSLCTTESCNLSR